MVQGLGLLLKTTGKEALELKMEKLIMEANKKNMETEIETRASQGLCVS